MTDLWQNRAKWIRIRMIILLAAMSFGAVAVAKSAWNLGVVRRDELNSLAEDQFKRSITIPARRGMITDRRGEPLAVEVEIDSVYANAKSLKNPSLAASLLSPVIGVDESTLVGKLSSKRGFVWLARQAQPDIAEKVKQLNIDGIGLIKESKRFYPNRSLAAHIIGFAGIDAVGLEGVELKFDAQLKGTRNAVLGQRDARGRVVFAGNVFGPEGVVGNSVELTIDKTLQYIAEQELKATISTFNAKAGQIIIMEPHTGEVLALADWPTYNPNTVSDSTSSDRKNRSALDVFEPGSTLKVFTLSAAFNAGAIRPDESIFCENGSFVLGENKKVTIHDDHSDGWLNPTQCLKKSSNICFAKIALKLGKSRLYHYLRRFGFGEKTHMDLPFEADGTLHHYNKWYDIDTATIAFGQGIGITGVQLITALSAIANGGVLMRPRLVRRIIGPDGETVRTFAPEPRRRVISEYTANLVADIMTGVTEQGGTGVLGSIDGYLVAAKTGTAQKADGGRGYAEGKWISSFISFVPADDPRLAILVLIDEPLISHLGGTVAAPALKRVADQALRYLGVSPKMQRSSQKKAESIKSKSKKDIQKDEFLSSSEEKADSSGIVLETNQVLMPNFLRKTMKQAMDILALNELKPIFMGTGFAIEQVPAPGSVIEKGSFVQINFEPEGLLKVKTEAASEDVSAEIGNDMQEVVNGDSK